MKKIIFFTTSIGFTLNLIWENLHSVLYTNVAPIMHIIPFYLIPTIGDTLTILVFYWLIAKINKNKFWIEILNYKDTLLLLMLGLVIGIVGELFYGSFYLWNYGPNMPIIPFVNVGLSPILQMMLLPLLTFYITKKLLKYKK